LRSISQPRASRRRALFVAYAILVFRLRQSTDASLYRSGIHAEGNLEIPVLSVHNLWDPLVPFPVNEPAFANTVRDAGASSMLLQRGVPNYGHCNFPTPLVVSSFQTLVNWVGSGEKPAS